MPGYSEAPLFEPLRRLLIDRAVAAFDPGDGPIAVRRRLRRCLAGDNLSSVTGARDRVGGAARALQGDPIPGKAPAGERWRRCNVVGVV